MTSDIHYLSKTTLCRSNLHLIYYMAPIVLDIASCFRGEFRVLYSEVKAVLLYAFESWTITNRMTDRLQVLTTSGCEGSEIYIGQTKWQI